MPARLNAAQIPVDKLGAVGTRLSRADGPLKVTGGARYAVEHELENLVHGVVVQSTTPSARVTAVDVTAARSAPGVLAVYTPQDSLVLRQAVLTSDGGAAVESFTPLQDDVVRFNGQHIAVVIAETFEQATEAAHLVRAEYAVSDAIIGLDDPKVLLQPLDGMKAEWGDAVAAMATADVKVEMTYTTPRNYNAPMELHACIAAWVGDTLTVWEPSQWASGAQKVISEWMGIGVENVRVISPYVGGGFGCKIAPHPHVALACAAAKELGRPVKLSLTRPQTFTGYGGRPITRQNLTLGATKDGKLVSIIHDGWNETSVDDMQVEPTNSVTTLMYATPNMSFKHSLVQLATVTPGWMRGPGEHPSSYGIESAMDELAYALNTDPLELRRINWAEQDPRRNVPWSTRQLREAYTAGAEAFGWSRRNPVPRSMREGRELIGWGMAAGTYPVLKTPSEARVILHANGKVEVHSSGADIGTGTYTILAQTAADVLGVPIVDVTVSLGDTALPRSALAAGSQLAGNMTGAVHQTAKAACDELLALAASDQKSPLQSGRADDLRFDNGTIRSSSRVFPDMTIAELLRAVGRDRLEVHGGTFKAEAMEADKNAAAHSFVQMGSPTTVSAHAWCAQFVEVRVDEDFGTIRVKRMVGAFDSGTVYNPKLAESQWIGGMIMGIGQALLEEGHVDPRDGRIINANLADYIVPVNADIPDITVLSVGVPDYEASVLGGKAVGELGLVGVAAAIGNAVFHATGKRVRDLPITIEKLI
jgi:xanthine dehydrogenase YagR molybdenum-binding subunit